MSKTSDYYFFVDDEDEENKYFCIVTKEFWRKNECLDDCADIEALEELLPKGFSESMESTYQYIKRNLSDEEAFKIGFNLLIELGFEQVHNPF